MTDQADEGTRPPAARSRANADDFNELAHRALDDIRRVLDPLNLDTLEPVLAALADAKRIACYGVGREGLMIKALAMRLYHLGMAAHVVGDMSAPALGQGDLLITSAGPGGFSTVDGLMQVARAAGARTLLFTAQPDGSAAALADTVCVLPAQTMANDSGSGGPVSLLPMGSVYEGAQFFLYELIVLKLRDRLNVTPEAMRARHTNLE